MWLQRTQQIDISFAIVYMFIFESLIFLFALFLLSTANFPRYLASPLKFIEIETNIIDEVFYMSKDIFSVIKQNENLKKLNWIKFIEIEQNLTNCLNENTNFIFLTDKISFARNPVYFCFLTISPNFFVECILHSNRW